MDEVEARETNAWPSFQAICEDLNPGGADAYVSYRVMSQMSHASAPFLDQYFEIAEDEPIGVRRRSTPARPNQQAWAGIAACSLVWAGQANRPG